MLAVAVTTGSMSAPLRTGAPTTVSQHGSGTERMARLRSCGSGQLKQTTKKKAAKIPETTVSKA